MANNTTATINNDEFKLAITMAGAASAGCYTGGVMDYLFEVLDLWQRAKQDIEEKDKGLPLSAPELKDYWDLVPRHQVSIDAIGGTSAGGMTSTMAAIYALNGKINPVKEPGEAKEWKDNLFYDSWVVMEDLDPKDRRETFEKCWDTEDLDDKWVRSLLNSKFIDTIADRCFDYKKDLPVQAKQLPAYISPDLQLILSHCMLRGIPLNVSFETSISKVGHKSILPDHTTYDHYVVSHYHLNSGVAPNPDHYYWLNPYDPVAKEMLRVATKATGAFPVGLLFREFNSELLNNRFLQNSIKRMVRDCLGTADPDPQNLIDLKYLAKDYSSVSIDGGAINNEPYRELNSLLKDKYGPTNENEMPRHGVIMIDPFPDKGSKDEDYTAPVDLLGVVPAIVGSLVDQSRVKRRELFENDSKDSFRSTIFPRKWVPIDQHPTYVEEDGDEENESGETIVTHPNPIASSAAMAFAGLLDIKFRQHDFFLGRNNARNFIRSMFSFPYDKEKGIVHPIHAGWSDAMKEKFMIKKEVKEKIDGEKVVTTQYFLPIIPDINFLLENGKGIGDRRYEYDIVKLPLYDPQKLFALLPVIRDRFLKIINNLAIHRSKEMDKLQKRRLQNKLEILNDKMEKAKAKLTKLNILPDSEKKNKSIRTKEKSNKKLQVRIDQVNNELNNNIPATNAGRWIKKEYKPGIFKKYIKAPFGKLAMGIAFLTTRKTIANTAAESAIKKIVTDLDANNCLKKIDNTEED